MYDTSQLFELTGLIGLDDSLEMLRVSSVRVFERLRIQSGPADCVGKVVTVVSAVGSPVPNQSHHLILELEPRPRLHGSRGEVGKQSYQGLLGRNLVGLHILGYGIRSGPSIGHTQGIRYALRIQQVVRPIVLLQRYAYMTQAIISAFLGVAYSKP